MHLLRFPFFFFILSDVIDFSLNTRQYYPLTSHLIMFNSGFDHEDQNYDNLKNR